MRRLAAALVAGGLVLPTAATAQSGDEVARLLASRSEARVAFHFEVDPEVTVCENGFRRNEDGTRSDQAGCPGGPLEVVVVRRADALEALEMGPVGESPRDADLGQVDPREAAGWLLSIHERGGSVELAEEAMVGAVMARDARPGPRLLALAGNRSLDSELRRAALFWVSQVAAQNIDATLAGIAADEAEDQEVRDAAVFALSQRPPGEAVPVLMEVARTAPHVRTRRTAMFWLSQSDDERVVDFFSELILGSGG